MKKLIISILITLLADNIKPQISISQYEKSQNGVSVGQPVSELLVPDLFYNCYAPAFFDWDGDTLKDLFFGLVSGRIAYYKNTGTKEHPCFTLVTSNFGGISVPYGYAAPFPRDLNGDGKIDFIVGNSISGSVGGTLHYFRGTGTIDNPTFELETAMLADTDLSDATVPFLIDIDNDGDLDLFIGEGLGRIVFIENTGSATMPGWSCPYQIIPDNGLYWRLSPQVINIQGDTASEMIVSEAYGTMALFNYQGKASCTVNFQQVSGSFSGIDACFSGGGCLVRPAFVDIDNDGDYDLFIRNLTESKFYFYRNLTTTTEPDLVLEDSIFAPMPPIAVISGDNTICNGENTTFIASGGEGYLWNTGAMTAQITVSPTVPTTYTVTVTDTNGCHDTKSVTLNFLPAANTTLQAAICEGETYFFNGKTLSAAGNYTANLTAANGCDSTATLTLNVLPAANSTLQAAICEGETYFFNGQTLSAAGNYTANLTAANGCDSTATLTLNVLPAANSTLQAAICEGETYSFNGQTFSAAGNYTANLTAANGCDSTVTLTLDLLAAPVANFTWIVNDSLAHFTNNSANADSYLWNFGDDSTSTEAKPIHIYTANGTYNVTLTATNLCGASTFQDTLNITVSFASDLQNRAFLAVFPNPNRGIFSVKMEGRASREVDFSLFDAVGRLVKRHRQAVQENQLHDFSGTPAGVYLLKIKLENGEEFQVRVVIFD